MVTLRYDIIAVLFVVTILIAIFFNFYNKFFITNYVKQYFPMEEILIISKVDKKLYFVVVTLLFEIYYFVVSIPVHSFLESIVLILITIFCFLYSIICLSISFILTDKRVLKISSFKIFNNALINKFNLSYNAVEILKFNKFLYNDEILLIDYFKKKYTIAGIKDLKFIYNTLNRFINKGD